MIFAFDPTTTSTNEPAIHSAPRGGDGLSTRARGRVTPVGVRLPIDLTRRESMNRMDQESGATHAPIRLLSDELVLECRARRKVDRHAPSGIISRRECDLHA